MGFWGRDCLGSCCNTNRDRRTRLSAPACPELCCNNKSVVRRSEMQVISIGSYLAAITPTAQPDLLYFNHWHVLVAFHDAREIPVIECPEQEPLHDAGGIRFRQLPPPLNRQALSSQSLVTLQPMPTLMVNLRGRFGRIVAFGWRCSSRPSWEQPICPKGVVGRDISLR